jgi:hypothetical protein
VVAVVNGLVAPTHAFVLLGVVVVAFASLLLAVTRRFGLALAVYILYLGLADGYLKLATGSNALTLLRTVLLAGIAAASLLVLVVDRASPRVPRGGILALGIVMIALVEIANPANPSLIKPIASLRQEVEFIPLFFLGYAAVRTEGALQTLLLLLVGVGVANGIANLVQYNLTPEQFANWGPGYRERILGTAAASGRTFVDAAGTGRPRTFGLGTDAGSGGIAGMLSAGAALALLMRPRATGPRGTPTIIRTAAAAALPFVVLAVVLSQTRAVVVATLVGLLVQAALTVRRQALPAVLVGGATIVVVLATVSHLTNTADASAISRYTGITPGEFLKTARSQRGQSLALATEYAQRFPLGAGLGSVGPATGFGGTVRSGERLDGETQFNVLLLDLGVPGALGVLSLTGAILLLFARIARHRDPVIQAQLAGLAGGFCGVCILFFSGAPLTGAPAGPYFWGIAGVLTYWLAAAASRVRTSAYSAAWAPQARSHVSGSVAERAAVPMARRN